MSYPNFYNQYQGIPQNQYQPQAMQVPQYQMPQSIPQITPQNAPQTVQQPQSSNSVIWVQGEAGAKSYLVAPGQTVWLMDSENLVFYIKSTDQSGMPLPLRIFDYTERNGAQNIPTAAANTPNIDMSAYATRAELAELEEKIASLTSQKKTNTRNKEDVTNG